MKEVVRMEKMKIPHKQYTIIDKGFVDVLRDFLVRACRIVLCIKDAGTQR